MTKLNKRRNLLFSITVISSIFFSQTVFAQNCKLPEMKQVIHAGGTVDNIKGTNSLEAVKSSFYNGYRYIELDFCFTTDNHLVSIHDWNENYFGADNAPYFNGAVSLEEFKGMKILGKYTPITLDILQEWILGKPDTYIITDIKSRNVEGLKYIKDKYPLLAKRTIPQIYKEDEYDIVKQMGYENIIYTLYAQSYFDKTNTFKINSFAQSNELVAIVFDKELANENYVTKLGESRVKLFTHTVNDMVEKEMYINMGISGIYSDYY